MRKFKDLQIVVLDNPKQGHCNIAENFKKHWNIPKETLDYVINESAAFDEVSIVVKDTGEHLLILQDQDGLVLGKLTDWIKDNVYGKVL